MAVVYSKVLLFDPPLIYTAPDICVFGAVIAFYANQVKLITINSDYNTSCSMELKWQTPPAPFCQLSIHKGLLRTPFTMK